MNSARSLRIAALPLACALVIGCQGGDDDASEESDHQTPRTPNTSTKGVAEPELRDELVEMMNEDQAKGRANDDERVRRLGKILDEHGWPTYALVGKKAEDAAWVIAQHADLHPEFQKRALRLLRRAAADEQASPGNLAYLTDRVAVAEGRPQTYGTQIRCTKQGPKAPTPINKRGTVDKRRAHADLDPLAAYYKQMAEICARGTG